MPKSNAPHPSRAGLARRVFERIGMLRRGERASRASRSDIERWLVERLAAELELDPREIDVRVPVDRYGLDSRTAASLSGELEDWLGRRISANALWEHPTIEGLARVLTEGEGAGEVSDLGGTH